MKKEKFYSKVNITDTHCWEWTGARKINGYGKFIFLGKEYLTHRYSFYCATGVDPKDLFVCHHCDNRICINPTHLFLGTAKDNYDDMISKGRHKGVYATKPGESNGRAKLTWKGVRSIRLKYIPFKNGVARLSKAYGVSTTAIYNIIKRKTWVE